MMLSADVVTFVLCVNISGILPLLVTMIVQCSLACLFQDVDVVYTMIDVQTLI